MIWLVLVGVLAAAAAMILRLSRQSAEKAVELRRARQSMEVKDAQLRVAADVRTGRSAVLERMRRGEL